MKNSTIIVLFVVLFLCIGLVACGSDILTEKIIGTWKQELVSSSSGRKSTSTATVTFTENGEMIRITISKSGGKTTERMKYELFKKDGKLVLGCKGIWKFRAIGIKPIGFRNNIVCARESIIVSLFPMFFGWMWFLPMILISQELSLDIFILMIYL